MNIELKAGQVWVSEHHKTTILSFEFNNFDNSKSMWVNVKQDHHKETSKVLVRIRAFKGLITKGEYTLQAVDTKQDMNTFLKDIINSCNTLKDRMEQVCKDQDILIEQAQKRLKEYK